MRSLRYFSLLGITATLAVTATASAAELADLVGGEVRQIVGDCKFTEGPAWHPDGYLLFTDISANRIVRVNPDGTHKDWLTESQGMNGLMCDQRGNVYGAQGNARQVVRMRPTTDPEQGRVVEVLTSGYDGRRLNQPNDLALDADGGLYFTDPNYRREEPEQPVEGVYYLSAMGETTRVIDDLKRPNGILVSADGRTLYVANIGERQIVRYDINGPGQISAGKVIFQAEQSDGGGPDGMSLDENGNIYATYQKLIVLTPEGDVIGRIDVPEKPANCTFGGTDNRTLYITARTSLYAIPMKVAGIALREKGPSATSHVSTESKASTDEPTETIKAGPLTLEIPKSWKQEQPSNRLRLAQFTVPAAEKDSDAGELVLSGPFGGSVQENVKRWLDQVETKDDGTKMTQGETDQGKYIWVELAGTYHMSVGPPVLRRTKPMPGYRVINVMFMSKGGNYFFKLAGPDATVKAAADALRASFGGDAAKESEFMLE